MQALRQDVAVSAVGRWRAVAGGEVIQVFTARGDRVLARIQVPLADREPLRMTAPRAALSARGRYVAAVTARSAVRIWPVAPSELMAIACARVPRDLSSSEWTAYLGTEARRPTCRR